MGTLSSRNLSSSISSSSSATSVQEEENEAIRRTPTNNRRQTRRRRRSGSGQRAVDDIQQSSSSESEEDLQISPKRQRIQNTSLYIYETFFIKGTGSDLTIKALDKEWKLHKNYLKQSHYFESMFSGHWLESDLSVIQLDIPDPNITVEALDVAFSSLYKDSVHLNAYTVTSTVAAAAMLQLDGLLEHCHEFMKETVIADNVVPYLMTALQYGLHDIKEQCNSWLQSHLLSQFTTSMLLNLSSEVLMEFIRSPDLFVIQVEMDVYSLAKKWLFLQCNPQWSGDHNKLNSAAEDFFRQKEGSEAYLSSEEGIQYQMVFQAIRLQHILVDPLSIAVLESDKIIPKEWLLPLYREQWLKMITVDQRNDSGPSSMNNDEFNALSVRCGRILRNSDEYCWRWTGYSFGVDIILSYNNGLVSVKRNTRSQPCLSAVSLQNARSLSLRLRVASFTDDNESLHTLQDTGIIHLSLAQDETAYILTIDKKASFPLYISLNYSLTSANHCSSSVNNDRLLLST